MYQAALLCLILAGPAQEPFKPLDLSSGMQTNRTSREDWVRATNQRFQMAGKSMRVAMEGPEGMTAVILAPGVEKPRHAKPILQGKGEHELLFRSLVGVGFSRIVVRNPDSGQEWAARLESGKAVLEF